MNLQQIAEMIGKINSNLYEVFPISFEQIEERVIKVTFEDYDFILCDNVTETRFRFVFTDYVGKIDDFRDFFDSILGNNVDLCDTSDFLTLSVTEATKVFEAVFK